MISGSCITPDLNSSCSKYIPMVHDTR